MVTVEHLSSLDCLIWLQACHAVGEAIGQHQTTVSRHQKKCAEAFSIQVEKSGGEWRISGDTELLQLEREVHQAARLQAHHRLRLEANGYGTTTLGLKVPQAWVIGRSRIQHAQHLNQLLKQRIIDAWLIGPRRERPADLSFQLIPIQRGSQAACLAVLAEHQSSEPVVDLVKALESEPIPVPRDGS